MKEIAIEKHQAGQRIDKFLKKYFSEAPLSFLYRLFRVKDVKVNGKRVDIAYILQENDVIHVYIKDDQLASLSKPKVVVSTPVQLSIIYEDENVLILNKPSGILIHGDAQEKRKTLSNQVIQYLYQKGEYDPASSLDFTPSPAHRLDRNTSGLVLFGKNFATLQSLYDILKEKKDVKKEYLALLLGTPSAKGEINAPIAKDEKKGICRIASLEQGGKTALTRYTIEEKLFSFTLTRAELVTGRTHQLRIHFSYIGHPIIGDAKYGSFETNKQFAKTFGYQNQFLHAERIQFGILTGRLAYLSGKTFIAPLGKKEKFILEQLRKGVRL